MKTWPKALPDYEMILWDTKRFDINSVLWVKQAFETGLYAFAADYIRLYAVYNYGGIYLDMDIEVAKSFNELLSEEIMLGYIGETADSGIQAACFGAVSGHPYIKKCMEYYEKTPLFPDEEMLAIMKLDRSQRYNYIRPIIAPALMYNICKQYFSDKNYKIYPCEYFVGQNLITGEIQKTGNTFVIDHSASAYISRAALKRRNFYRFIAKTFGENHLITKIMLRLRDMAWRLHYQKIWTSIRARLIKPDQKS
jgi:hypothetical protein